MNIAIMIYLFEVTHDINICAGTVMLILIIACFVLAISYFIADYNAYDEEDKKKAANILRWFRRCLYCLFITVAVGILVPDAKTLGAMYLVPKIANNEQIQGISKNSLEILKKLTADWAKELSGEKD